ncbi:hypothetical protein MBLNU230_g6166t1 [Neophaeotheca triangularis]
MSAIPLREKGLEPQLNPVVAFVDNHLASVHPKFEQLSASDAVYSVPKGRYVEHDSQVINEPIQVTDEMNRQQQEFLEAAARFEKDNKVKLDFRLDRSSDYRWNDVVEQLNGVVVAYDRYKYLSNAKSDHIRKCLRKLRSSTVPCEQFLQFLPSESWQGSGICGGMKLVLAAAHQLNQVNSEIIDSIQQIPFTMEIVKDLARCYDTGMMRYHVSELVVTILQLLQECLAWLTRNPVTKAFSALKGSDHAKGLKEKRAALRGLGHKIDQIADAGLHAKMHEMYTSSREGGVEVNVLNNALGLFTGNLETAVATLERTCEKLQYDEGEKRQQEEHSRKREEIILALEKQLGVVIDTNKRGFLLELGYDPVKQTQDLLDCLKTGIDTNIRAQDRAVWLFQSAEILTWLQSDSSSHILVVNGREASHERDSPVSLFSAMMAQALAEQSKDVVLYWTCYRNIHDRADHILRDATGQLLQKGERNILLAVTLSGLRADCTSFDDLLAIFMCLLDAQLKKSSVFFILDCVSFYEDRKRYHDTRDFFNSLYDLADKDTGEYRLKVLATSPTRCGYLGTRLDDGNPKVLSMPPVVERHRLRAADGVILSLNERETEETESPSR